MPSPNGSSYYGVQIVCVTSGGCPNQGQNNILVGGLNVTVDESETPYLVAQGSNNLYYQSSTWVWNAPGDPWPVTLYGSDPSGICSMVIAAGGVPSYAPSVVRNPAIWQQCPSGWSWNGTVDTTNSVPTAGHLSLQISDTDAASNTNTASTTLNVDNVKPTISLTPTNDPDPTHWTVNHGVTLQVSAGTGPSGLSGVSCTDSRGGVVAPLTLAADGPAGQYQVSVDGNGAHTVACTVANNAVNAAGAHDTTSVSQTVDIDEQPPTVSFEPSDPAAPSQVVVDASDDESGVSGGVLEIAPVGSTSQTPLKTTFTSSGQLIATIPDNRLKAGTYTVRASATSLAGNTGAASETVTLPLRTPTTEEVSFAKFVDPGVARKVKERVRVGWHWGAKLNKAGKPIKVKVGGHFKTITVIKRVGRCTTKRIKTGRHRWKLRTRCIKPHVHYVKKLTVGFGRSTEIYGEVLSQSGVPVVGQTVDVQSAADNGHDRYSKIRTARTNADGGWKLKLLAGPSRIVRVTYPGSDTELPAAGRIRLYVPARIKVRATPNRLPWNGSTTIHGKLEGGYVPKDGVAMRLLIKLPGRTELYSPAAFRTSKKGTFSIKWSWGRGAGVAAYPFSVATTSTESDYPFTASRSGSVMVTFGVRTPRRGANADASARL